MGEDIAFTGRRDMTRQHGESWRPPVFAPPAASSTQRLIAVLRRFFDLQAGTIWSDLSITLPQSEGIVLDVGCGSQPYRNLVNPAAKYIAIDTADAKAHFGYEMPDTRYFTGNIWPIEDSSIDVLLSTEAMEHIPDTRQFISEIARVLRPGGKVILTVPFAARYHYIPHDFWRFTPACLEMLFRDAGFNKIAVYARGNAVTVACYKVMALILPLLFPGGRPFVVRCLSYLVGLTLSPILILLAVIANLSARGAGGNDCLGYTLVALL